MKAYFIDEALGFERGRDSKESIGIGIEARIKKEAKRIVRYYKFNMHNSHIREQACLELEHTANCKVLYVDTESDLHIIRITISSPAFFVISLLMVPPLPDSPPPRIIQS